MESTLDAFDEWMKTSGSRETSPEIMEAIWEVADGDIDLATAYWNGDFHADEPRRDGGGVLVAIVEKVTNNGMYDVEDFTWGAAGYEWCHLLMEAGF